MVVEIKVIGREIFARSTYRKSVFLRVPERAGVGCVGASFDPPRALRTVVRALAIDMAKIVWFEMESDEFENEVTVKVFNVADRGSSTCLLLKMSVVVVRIN